MESSGTRTVIVTGAAGGIGSALAEAYYLDGYKVVMADNDEKKGREVASRIGRARSQGEESGGEEPKPDALERLLFCKTDLRNPEEITRLVETGQSHFGSIDIVINNAGFGIWKSPYDLSVEEWDDVLLTNLRGTFICAREAAARMRDSGRGGAIVNIASTRAMMSEPGSEAYAASKGGIVALTHALAVSLGRDRITVNCISPGWIETGNYEALRELDHRQHPAGRVGRVADIVRACQYLTDPRNDFVTGINLVVDGGMTRKMIYEPDEK
ncbi:SDR family NAD(P)-dependent oxidoreductase [Paenibacillus beijingensis]|uniref:3-ketoacyl-ACP reductase n=1 Tax=Paenibacillus beijingensis TaxID=1126833 RepID=A0A0D5NPV3_9BACL|nr:SDR family oxidoreductase [Paenibacillus beijingensis]AJY77037.1 3-ketoacyl-ACP reductase [Paenibacillus beijingensis]